MHYGLLKSGDDKYLQYSQANECSVDGCTTGKAARGLCNKHYKRWQVYGQVDLPQRETKRACNSPNCTNPVPSRNRNKCLKHSRKAHRTVDKESAKAVRAQHDGKCAICKTDVPGGAYNSWQLDHDHKTTMARGMLCAKCNSAIGMFDDNIVIMDLAAKYLLKDIDVLNINRLVMT